MGRLHECRLNIGDI